MAGSTSIIVDFKRLSHQAADELCLRALRQPLTHTVVFDLEMAEDATTAGFARLVLLRRDLLRDGRDLRLSGLTRRTANLWRINRLATVLPVQ